MASTAQKQSNKQPKDGAEAPPQTWESRAVLRLIEPGSVAECPHCGDRVKFRARHRDQQVICNVYDKGVWQRVEQYHQECYDKADSPHGDAVKN
jgi:DNA-directed RNA polymerase subunit RPC12/RpoP